MIAFYTMNGSNRNIHLFYSYVLLPVVDYGKTTRFVDEFVRVLNERCVESHNADRSLQSTAKTVRRQSDLIRCFCEERRVPKPPLSSSPF